jgi:hypothetical protein
MCNSLRYIGGGVVIVLAMLFVAVSSGPVTDLVLQFVSLESADASEAPIVDRSGKGDKMKAAFQASSEDTVIATVEVIGLRDAAVIYRARDGRVLFSTDPVANATVVAKGLVLPEVTIREARRPTQRTTPASVQTVPVTPPGEPVPTANEPKMLEGCDPAFSPLTARANFTGRCLAANSTPIKMASALH